MTPAWLAFWNGSHSISVSARHKDVHYRLIAKAIAALVPRPDARVLDYGCGEALHADSVAAAAGELLLCEAAPRVRAGLAARFANDPQICAVAPEEVERLPDHSLDLVVLRRQLPAHLHQTFLGNQIVVFNSHPETLVRKINSRLNCEHRSNRQHAVAPNVVDVHADPVTQAVYEVLVERIALLVAQGARLHNISRHALKIRHA